MRLALPPLALATSLEAVLLQLHGTFFTQLVRLPVFLVWLCQTSRLRLNGRAHTIYGVRRTIVGPSLYI